MSVNDGFESLSDIIRLRQSVRGTKVAFTEKDVGVTTDEFYGLIQGARNFLVQIGIRRGDRVGLWLTNSVEWLALYFGLSAMGCTILLVNTKFRQEELIHVAHHSKIRWLIMEPRYRETNGFDILRSAIDRGISFDGIAVFEGHSGDTTDMPDSQVNCVRFDGLTLRAEGAKVSASSEVTGLGEAQVVFTTSGSTGGPKLVVHDACGLLRHSAHAAGAFEMQSPTTVLLGVLPFCGVFGLNSVLAAFLGGGQTIIQKRFDPAAAARMLVGGSVTHVFGSDEIYAGILANIGPDEKCRNLVSCSYGIFGAATREQLRAAAIEKDMPLNGLYGMSEVQALFSRSFGETLDARMEAGGLPTDPGVRLRVRDLGGDGLVEMGEIGVLEISSYNNFIGYMLDGVLQDPPFDGEGFFSTGDLAKLMSDGSFVYLERANDLIRLGGFLCSPIEIEGMLMQVAGGDFEDVKVTVAEIGGRTQCVGLVKLKDGHILEPGKISNEMKKLVAAYKVPAILLPVDSFPTAKSANGDRIQRKRLPEFAERLIQATS